MSEVVDGAAARAAVPEQVALSWDDAPFDDANDGDLAGVERLRVTWRADPDAP
jgi:hypothetical protein